MYYGKHIAEIVLSDLPNNPEVKELLLQPLLSIDDGLIFTESFSYTAEC